MSEHHSILERLFTGAFSSVHSRSAFNALHILEGIVSVGQHIFLPAMWNLQHGDCLALLKTDKEHSHN